MADTTPAVQPKNREMGVELSPDMIKAAEEGNVEEVLRLRKRYIVFRDRKRKNAFGPVGLKIELKVPCDSCGFGLFYNDDAGAECMVCGKLHRA